MKDLIFNELSVNPVCTSKTEVYSRLNEFIKIYKAAKEFNFNRIRFVESFDKIVLSLDGYTLNDFCFDNRTLGTLLLGLSRYPFIDDDSSEADRFIENTFYIDENSNKIKTYGLATVYLYSTIGIGLASSEHWKKLIHKLIIEGKEEQVTTVLCLSKPDHIKADEFQRWIDDNTEVQLVVSDIPIEKKKISLRNDHGKDKLLEFSKKLLKSPYVLSIINSLPYNSGVNKFIKKITPTGKIEIVLFSTDRGLGLVIETTGRNLKETQCIAEKISEQYG